MWPFRLQMLNYINQVLKYSVIMETHKTLLVLIVLVLVQLLVLFGMRVTARAGRWESVRNWQQKVIS